MSYESVAHPRVEPVVLANIVHPLVWMRPQESLLNRPLTLDDVTEERHADAQNRPPLKAQGRRSRVGPILGLHENLSSGRPRNAKNNLDGAAAGVRRGRQRGPVREAECACGRLKVLARRTAGRWVRGWWSPFDRTCFDL